MVFSVSGIQSAIAILFLRRAGKLLLFLTISGREGEFSHGFDRSVYRLLSLFWGFESLGEREMVKTEFRRRSPVHEAPSYRSRHWDEDRTTGRSLQNSDGFVHEAFGQMFHPYPNLIPNRFEFLPRMGVCLVSFFWSTPKKCLKCSWRLCLYPFQLWAE